MNSPDNTPPSNDGARCTIAYDTASDPSESSEPIDYASIIISLSNGLFTRPPWYPFTAPAFEIELHPPRHPLVVGALIEDPDPHLSAELADSLAADAIVADNCDSGTSYGNFGTSEGEVIESMELIDYLNSVPDSEDREFLEAILLSIREPASLLGVSMRTGFRLADEGAGHE